MTMIEEMEMKLADLSARIYEEGGRKFKPLYPWVLVRLLPKEQKVGEIWMPEKQEKTLYEGIVLEIYPVTTKLIKNKAITYECPVLLGDRICFPHFEGLPIKGWDDKYYRMVRIEADQDLYAKCGVYGVLDYEGDKEFQRELRELFARHRPEMQTLSAL